jgi:hypothetical protein
MKTNTKFDKSRIQFEQQRNARNQQHVLSDNISNQWERPTYLAHIGQNTSEKWMKGDFIQSMVDSVKPGQMHTDPVFVRPPEIKMPGNGFGYASMHGSFLHPNSTHVESRLFGLGLTHPHTPSAPVQGASIPYKTVQTYAPPIMVREAPIQYVKRPGWM